MKEKGSERKRGRRLRYSGTDRREGRGAREIEERKTRSERRRKKSSEGESGENKCCFFKYSRKK